MIETRDQWRTWVTPRLLRSAAVHRWYAFPHSFTGELVTALIDEWGLNETDVLADPFVGAGTTVLAAKAKGIPAIGFDLSPLAVFITNTKVNSYRVERLDELWKALSLVVKSKRIPGTPSEYPELVRLALPAGILGTFARIDAAIGELPTTHEYKRFFRLALLSVLPTYSRAVATGGWLKWVKRNTRSSSIQSTFARRVELMLEDVQNCELPRATHWKACEADARDLGGRKERFSAVITSPPYPNRHDYTRVFGVELMFGFLSWEETRAVRYQSIHSHPEARPQRPECPEYNQPSRLHRALVQLEVSGLDPKILQMLKGYFLDMHLCLKECKRVVKPEGRIAFVVGNAQYRGIAIPVDELLTEIAAALGLEHERIFAVRYRGNSAQQMGEFGRRPSRESVVIFKKA